jgi:chromate transporter
VGLLLRPYQLFLLFSHAAVLGFGGVLPWAYRLLVERKELLTKAEFVDLFSFGQILPGPPICNIAMLFGHRHAGVIGGFCALAGLVVAPTLFVIVLGIAYQRFGDVALVHNALSGMAAVAAGLVVAMALKMASDLPRQWKHMLFAALMFASIALARWPLITVLAVLAPVAVIAFWKELQS